MLYKSITAQRCNTKYIASPNVHDYQFYYEDMLSYWIKFYNNKIL